MNLFFSPGKDSASRLCFPFPSVAICGITAKNFAAPKVILYATGEQFSRIKQRLGVWCLIFVFYMWLFLANAQCDWYASWQVNLPVPPAWNRMQKEQITSCLMGDGVRPTGGRADERYSLYVGRIGGLIKTEDSKVKQEVEKRSKVWY